MAVAEDKRRQILDAAVRVFAAQRLRGSRGSATSPARPASPTGSSTTTSGRRRRYSRPSSARRGGGCSPRSPWPRRPEATRQSSSSSSVKIVLRAWRDDPDLVRLLVREVTRSPPIQDELDEIGQAFATLRAHRRAGPARRHVPGRPRRAARGLDALRRTRRGAHGLGARAAARRRRDGRGRRARGDRNAHRRTEGLRSPHARSAEALAAAARQARLRRLPVVRRRAAHAGARRPRRRRRRDHRRADRRPRLRPAGHAVRAAGDPRRRPVRPARTSKPGSTRSRRCASSTTATRRSCPADPAAHRTPRSSALVGEVVDAGVLPGDARAATTRSPSRASRRSRRGAARSA